MQANILMESNPIIDPNSPRNKGKRAARVRMKGLESIFKTKIKI